MSESNGIVARLIRAERDIEKLFDHKADADDVQRLADEFHDLKRTLQWFMGIIATAVITFCGLVVTLLQGIN